MRIWRWLLALWLAGASHAWAQGTWLRPGDLTDSTVWNTADFLAAWPSPPQQANPAAVTRSHLFKPPALFSLPVQSASARFVHGQLDSLSIVLLDAGDFFGYEGANLHGQTPEQARKAFDEAFTRERAALLAALEKLSAHPPTPFQPGEHGAFRVKALLFHERTVWARVFAVEHQLLMVDFFRTEPSARTLKSGSPPPAPVIDPFKPRAETGDHLVEGIPMVEQGNRGYCGVATLAMIGQFLGLQPGAEEYAALSGYQYGDTKSPDIRELCSRVAQEAGFHALRAERFDFDRARASIDAGLPVLVFRRWAPQRDYIHTLYTSRIARGDATATLPEPTMEDRRTWPGKDAPAHASIVHGYQAQRREVIFSESWGEAVRARRMRAEEMEGTSYYAVYFTR